MSTDFLILKPWSWCLHLRYFTKPTVNIFLASASFVIQTNRTLLFLLAYNIIILESFGPLSIDDGQLGMGEGRMPSFPISSSQMSESYLHSSYQGLFRTLLKSRNPVKSNHSTVWWSKDSFKQDEQMKFSGHPSTKESESVRFPQMNLAQTEPYITINPNRLTAAAHHLPSSTALPDSSVNTRAYSGCTSSKHLASSSATYN